MKFTCFEFNLLPLHHRALLLERDCFLQSCLQDGINYLLYAYAGYYVEVCMDNATDNLMSITAFTESAGLERYLDTLVLEQLLC
jgi:hypothetical protein